MAKHSEWTKRRRKWHVARPWTPMAQRPVAFRENYTEVHVTMYSEDRRWLVVALTAAEARDLANELQVAATSADSAPMREAQAARAAREEAVVADMKQMVAADKGEMTDHDRDAAEVFLGLVERCANPPGSPTVASKLVKRAPSKP